MPMWSSGLSRSASRWAFQVSASLGATLIAALVVQALPRATPEPAAPPEMTSGGKFAARVASARAYDGLDTMPLPHVDVATAEPRASIVPAAFLSAPPVDIAGFGAALRDPLSDGAANRPRSRAARPVRAPAHAEASKRAAPGETVPAAAADAADPSEGGLLHQVATRTRQVWTSTSATTREAWSTTASVGSSLISRILP